MSVLSRHLVSMALTLPGPPLTAVWPRIVRDEVKGKQALPPGWPSSARGEWSRGVVSGQGGWATARWSGWVCPTPTEEGKEGGGHRRGWTSEHRASSTHWIGWSPPRRVGHHRRGVIGPSPLRPPGGPVHPGSARRDGHHRELRNWSIPGGVTASERCSVSLRGCERWRRSCSIDAAEPLIVSPSDRPPPMWVWPPAFPLDLWRGQGETPCAAARRQGVEERPSRGGAARGRSWSRGESTGRKVSPALPLAGAACLLLHGPAVSSWCRPPPDPPSSIVGCQRRTPASECRVEATEWVDPGRTIGCRPSSGVERVGGRHPDGWGRLPLH